MAYVFDMQLHKVQIPAEMPEWERRFPVPGPDQDYIVTIVHGWRDGARRTTAEEMPRELIAPKPRKAWPDALRAVNGLHVVTGRAKDAIERLNPTNHQFFPLELRTKRGVDIEGPWFAMVVTVEQDSILVNRSRVYVSNSAPDRLCDFHVDSKTTDVVVDPSQQSSDIHLWREKRFHGSLLCSDALADAFAAEDIKFFPHYRATDLPDAAG